MAELYKKSGVDIDLADEFVEKIKKMVRLTQGAQVISGVGGFASLFEINKTQIIAASTDGVGTKLKIAQALKSHKTIGQDLVAMCVNDLICTGAKPLFFLDYFATGRLDIGVGAQVVEGICKACQSVGVALVGGETAEMPGIYEEGIYDLAGFAVGLVNKNKVLTGKNIKEGDLLVGLKSSGLHSNGFSLFRSLFKSSETDWLKKALTPTRLYVNPVLKALEKFPKKIKAAAHITGSGFLNIPRVNENFDYEIHSVPSLTPLYKEIIKRGGLSTQELYTTFNGGVGFVLVIDPKIVPDLLKALVQWGEKPFLMGQVRKGQGLLNMDRVLCK